MQILNDVGGFFRDLAGDFARWLYKKTHGLDPLTTIRDLRQDLVLAEQGNKFLRGELTNGNNRAKTDSVAFKGLYKHFHELRDDTAAILTKAIKKPLTVRDYKKFEKYSIVITVVPKRKKKGG